MSDINGFGAHEAAKLSHWTWGFWIGAGWGGSRKKAAKTVFSDCIGEDGFTLAWRAQVVKRSEADVPSETIGKMK